MGIRSAEAWMPGPSRKQEFHTATTSHMGPTSSAMADSIDSRVLSDKLSASNSAKQGGSFTPSVGQKSRIGNDVRI